MKAVWATISVNISTCEIPTDLHFYYETNHRTLKERPGNKRPPNNEIHYILVDLNLNFRNGREMIEREREREKDFGM